MLMEDEPKMPVLEISDNEIVSILEECEAQTMALTQQVDGAQGQQQYITKQVVQQKKSSPQVPIVNNCTISGNITI